MSVRALDWSFRLRLYDMAAKAALNALADHADEHGMCWPSVGRIALFAGCSEKTARRALQRLTELGIVTRSGRPGQSDMFTLNFEWADPSQVGSGQSDHTHPDHSQDDQTPLPTCPDTPPKLTGDPSQAGSRTVKNRQLNRQGTVSQSASRSQTGSRLPAGWQPSDEDRAFAEPFGIDLEATASVFRDYWHGVPGAKGRKQDWPATWRNWVRREAQTRQGREVRETAEERRIRLCREAVKEATPQ